jgi:hypothetical protein
MSGLSQKCISDFISEITLKLETTKRTNVFKSITSGLGAPSQLRESPPLIRRLPSSILCSLVHASSCHHGNARVTNWSKQMTCGQVDQRRTLLSLSWLFNDATAQLQVLFVVTWRDYVHRTEKWLRTERSNKYYDCLCLTGLKETTKTHNDEDRYPDRKFREARITFIVRESIKSLNSERHHHTRSRRLENTGRNSRTHLSNVGWN